MDIKNIVLVFTIFVLLGCSGSSDIFVSICNHSGVDKTDIILNWNRGEKRFMILHNGECKKIKLTNLIGENHINLMIGKQKYLIDVYFEANNYQGDININLINKDKVTITSNVNLE